MSPRWGSRLSAELSARMDLAISAARASRRLELDHIGGRPGNRGGRPGAIAERLNGGANAAGIGGGERELLAIDLDGFAVDVGGDLPVGTSGDAGDFGETEVGVAELGVLTDE